jgi:hypothetical protein
MDKSILKMVAIVTVIAITLLVRSLCIAMRYGGIMMKSVNSSDKTSQDNGNGTSDSSGNTNQKSMNQKK